jgi:peptidoglycan L-alanyl-D-glutamate endopeptidase CwlK
MGYGLGERSRKNLEGVHPKLIDVVERAIELTEQDFFVNEGVRTMERQKELYAQGRTKPGPKVTWTLNSNHFKNPNTGFGHAVDVYPFPYKDVNSKAYAAKQMVVAKAMLKAAHELNIPIRWGADWDMDGNYGERGEGDSPHFELWGF